MTIKDTGSASPSLDGQLLRTYLVALFTCEDLRVQGHQDHSPLTILPFGVELFGIPYPLRSPNTDTVAVHIEALQETST